MKGLPLGNTHTTSLILCRNRGGSLNSKVYFILMNVYKQAVQLLLNKKILLFRKGKISVSNNICNSVAYQLRNISLETNFERLQVSNRAQVTIPFRNPDNRHNFSSIAMEQQRSMAQTIRGNKFQSSGAENPLFSQKSQYFTPFSNTEFQTQQVKPLVQKVFPSKRHLLLIASNRIAESTSKELVLANDDVALIDGSRLEYVLGHSLVI